MMHPDVSLRCHLKEAYILIEKKPKSKLHQTLVRPKTFLDLRPLLCFSYRVVMTMTDPVVNSVELQDLRPYTIYHLDVRNRLDRQLISTLNFSTASKPVTIQHCQ